MFILTSNCLATAALLPLIIPGSSSAPAVLTNQGIWVRSLTTCAPSWCDAGDQTLDYFTMLKCIRTFCRCTGFILCLCPVCLSVRRPLQCHSGALYEGECRLHAVNKHPDIWKRQGPTTPHSSVIVVHLRFWLLYAFYRLQLSSYLV